MIGFDHTICFDELECNLIIKDIWWYSRSLGFRPGLQTVTGALSSLFFLGLFYRSASLYHPQRRAILHLKDMSKRKGKDKAKIENKPPYFDLTTLKAKPFHIILLATAFAAFGAYTPLFFFVSNSFIFLLMLYIINDNIWCYVSSKQIIWYIKIDVVLPN